MPRPGVAIGLAGSLVCFLTVDERDDSNAVLASSDLPAFGAPRAIGEHVDTRLDVGHRDTLVGEPVEN